jgi:hypothetical protein
VFQNPELFGTQVSLSPEQFTLSSTYTALPTRKTPTLGPYGISAIQQYDVKIILEN